MNFQSLAKIENSKFYVNLAFSYAKERAEAAREGIKGQRSVVEKSKTVELAKIEAVRNSIAKNLTNVVENFPKTTQLNEFYNELLKCYVDVIQLKRSLASVKWAAEKVNDFYREYSFKIKRTTQSRGINSNRKIFYGRAASAVKQVNKSLEFIEEARKIMRGFPSIKENIFTVAIAGFPNVGKSTVLNKLTGAHAEIANYAFTTRSLNLGYMFEDGKRIVQVIDTPGTLNRHEKMNYIEIQAELAMSLCANLIIYIFDPTESYPVEDQIKLLRKIKEIGKPIILYASKTDIAEVPEKLKKAKYETNPEKLKDEILKMAASYNKSLKENLPEQEQDLV